jgi:hypothetical protein
MVLTPRPSNKVLLLSRHIKAFHSLVKSVFFVLNNIACVCGYSVPRCTKHMPDYKLCCNLHSTFQIFCRLLFKCCLRECVSLLRPKLKHSGKPTALQVIETRRQIEYSLMATFQIFWYVLMGYRAAHLFPVWISRRRPTCEDYDVIRAQLMLRP